MLRACTTQSLRVAVVLVEVAAVPEGAVVQVQVGRHAADDAAVQIVANPQSHEPLVAGAHWTNRRQVLAVVLLEVGAVPEGDCGVDDVWVAKSISDGNCQEPCQTSVLASAMESRGVHSAVHMH